MDAEDGDLVAVGCRKAQAASGLPTARVKERLGSLKSERAVSLIAIHAHASRMCFRREAIAEAEAAKPATSHWPRRLARDSARHHRSGRRQGSRRRGVCRARHRSEQSRRLHRQRRHRRRRPLREARLGARPRGAGARQFGLFPRPRRADAAGAHLQRSVLAAAARGPRRACGAHGDRRRRPQALAHVPPHPDALGREAALRAGAGRHRRPHRRRSPRRWSRSRARAALRRLSSGEARARRARPARSRSAGAQDPAEGRRHASTA